MVMNQAGVTSSKKKDIGNYSRMYKYIGGITLLCVIYSIMFYDIKKGSALDRPKEWLNVKTVESCLCVKNITKGELGTIKNSECYTNPFFLLSLLVFVSIILNACLGL